MPDWIPRVLRRVRALAAAKRVRFTLKAMRELALLGLDADDAVEVLASVRAADAHGRLRSAITREWMYVLKPRVGDVVVYLKLVVREDCIVVSFHEDEASHDDPA